MVRLLQIAALLFFPFFLNAEWIKTTYTFSKEPIDVVIPCAPKDQEMLSLCIDGIREHGKNIRRIIVVSKERLTEKAEWFSETDYPFSKEDIAKEIAKSNSKKLNKLLTKKNSRLGWIYQQFLKFYAPLVIPNISSNVLILDADVLFIRPVEFTNEEGAPLFNISDEYHRPYFDHMKRLLPQLHRVHESYSGITHHMLFQRPILEDLFTHITKQHQIEPWKAICRQIDPTETSCVSEYEIYFNFALLRTNQAMIRTLPFADVHPVCQIENYINQGYSYITSHERP